MWLRNTGLGMTMHCSEMMIVKELGLKVLDSSFCGVL